jgi:kynureninase
MKHLALTLELRTYANSTKLRNFLAQLILKSCLSDLFEIHVLVQHRKRGSHVSLDHESC